MSRLTMSPRRTCRKCGETKGQGYFRPQKRVCKKCEYARRDLTGELAAARRYRAKNREELNRKSRAKACAFRVWVDSLKEGSCADCGESYPPYVMDWDHVRGAKKYNIAMLRIRYAYRNIKRLILDEIAKCELVCSNCHRVRTHKRRCKKRRL